MPDSKLLKMNKLIMSAMTIKIIEMISIILDKKTEVNDSCKGILDLFNNQALKASPAKTFAGVTTPNDSPICRIKNNLTGPGLEPKFLKEKCHAIEAVKYDRPLINMMIRIFHSNLKTCSIILSHSIFRIKTRKKEIIKKYASHLICLIMEAYERLKCKCNGGYFEFKILSINYRYLCGNFTIGEVTCKEDKWCIFLK